MTRNPSPLFTWAPFPLVLSHATLAYFYSEGFMRPQRTYPPFTNRALELLLALDLALWLAALGLLRFGKLCVCSALLGCLGLGGVNNLIYPKETLRSRARGSLRRDSTIVA